MEKSKTPQQTKTLESKSDGIGFAGTWTATGPVYIYNTKTGNVKVEQQSIVLSITKFADKIFLGTFTELTPTPGATFNFVANQTTENKNLIQSATSGLNSFYFTGKDGVNVLNANWNTSTTSESNVVSMANLKFSRKCNCETKI